jgi:hypothetical protein
MNSLQSNRFASTGGVNNRRRLREKFPQFQACWGFTIRDDPTAVNGQRTSHN